MDFTIVREIKRPAAQVFLEIGEGKLFEATGIVDGSLTISFYENGSYSFSWPEAGKCRGEFTKISMDRKIQFTWIKSPASYNKESFATLVDIQLSPSQGKTQLILTHSRFDLKEAYESHLEGWNEVLDDFASSE